MRMIHAELKIDSCPAELWLNDIPIKGLTPKLAHNISVPAHLYLLDGANTLEIVVNPGPTPSIGRRLRQDATPAGAATARVAAYQAGQFTGDPAAPVLLETSWNASGAEPGAFPQIAQTANDLGSMFGPWHWERADSLQSDSANISGAAAVLETLRDSLAAGDPDVLLRLGYRRFKNASDAYPERPFSILVDQRLDERSLGMPRCRNGDSRHSTPMTSTSALREEVAFWNASIAIGGRL